MRPALTVVLLLVAQALWAAPAPTPQAAVVRALPLLQRSAQSFVEQRACVSCHHNILPILVLHMAQDRGLRLDGKALTAVETRTFRELRGPQALDEAIQGVNVSDPTPNDSLLLMAANAARLPRDLTLEVYARRIARWQRGDHWETSDFRPPHSSSSFTATATAIRALQAYMPDALEAERDAVIGRARAWLAATPPQSTEDASYRLLGLVWSGAGPDVMALARRDLVAMQDSTGGWPQLPGYRPDAYSTGEALVALRDGGMPIADRIWQRGVAHLLATQADDGSWRVRTRMLSPAEISPPYFTTGFPYRKDEFLSYAGTSWAVMALLAAMPAGSAGPGGPALRSDPEPAGQGGPALRSALFGTSRELTELLDKGLDPNTATAQGTTLLMAAAADADTVRLLLGRGANASTRAQSGVDAVTVATTYRGTSDVVRLLLDAGSTAAPPAGVRLRHAPLIYASMAGDLDVAALLLARGAPASAEALAESITFDNPVITRALLKAGADAQGRESTGATLLHWAAITNRPAAVPLLVDAGVPVNAQDDFGFTALMYAATVDVGDTRLVSALLQAGADSRIRNAAGRTALQQAVFLEHDSLARTLRERRQPQALPSP